MCRFSADQVEAKLKNVSKRELQKVGQNPQTMKSTNREDITFHKLYDCLIWTHLPLIQDFRCVFCLEAMQFLEIIDSQKLLQAKAKHTGKKRIKTCAKNEPNLPEGLIMSVKFCVGRGSDYPRNKDTKQ